MIKIILKLLLLLTFQSWLSAEKFRVPDSKDIYDYVEPPNNKFIRNIIESKEIDFKINFDSTKLELESANLKDAASRELMNKKYKRHWDAIFSINEIVKKNDLDLFFKECVHPDFYPEIKGKWKIEYFQWAKTALEKIINYKGTRILFFDEGMKSRAQITYKFEGSIVASKIEGEEKLNFPEAARGFLFLSHEGRFKIIKFR